jgi:hypothetical protein
VTLFFIILLQSVVARTLFDLSLSCFVLQWQELFAIVKQAKRNNPGKAGKYPETREGLLALEELYLRDCKLTGIVLTCVTHSYFTKPTSVCGLEGRGGGRIQIKNI